MVVIATILFFLSKYPLHLGRNTYVSSAFFSVLFLSDAARLLIDSLAPSLYVHSVDRTEGVIISLCLAGWVALLQPETARSLVPAGVPSLHEGQLLQQLDSLNQLMSRAARR